MKGSIRFFLGLLITLFAVGGIENSLIDSDLVKSCLLAAVGLVLMASGSNAMKDKS